MGKRMAGAGDARRAAAYHEAGHAVADLVQGLTVITISIIPDGNNNGTCWSPGDYYDATLRERRAIGRAIVLGCFAGLEAGRLFDPDAPEDHGSGARAVAF